MCFLSLQTLSERSILKRLPSLLPGAVLLVHLLSAWPSAAREPEVAVIPARTFPIIAYGAKGDGVTVNTDAFAAAIKACVKAGGGRVVVPAGTFLTGPIELAGRTALVLEKGAIVQGTGRFSDFGLPDPLPAAQEEINASRKALHPLISAVGAEDVAILGEGTIDGAGGPWWAKSDKAAERALVNDARAGESAPTAVPAEKRLYVPRPHLVLFRNCTRVHVQGVTLQKSPRFLMVPHRSREVVGEVVRIFSPEDAPNTDGIDPANCREVLIRRCSIDTGDDNIALKGGGVGGQPTENVAVMDCTFLHGHGVSIGSETQAGVRNFLVERCTFEGTGTALRIKSDRTLGGVIENVIYRKITMHNVDIPITVFLYYADKKAAVKPELQPITENTPHVGRIRFEDINCDGALKKAGEIIGLPESPGTEISMERVRITRAAAPLSIQDLRGLRWIDVDVQSVNPGEPAPAP